MGIEQPEIRTAVQQPTLVRRATLGRSELVNWFAKTYGEIATYLGDHGLTPKGHPFARYHVRGDGRFDVEAGFPVVAKLAGDASVLPSTLPGGEQAVIWHTGPYDQVGVARTSLAEWIEQQGGTPDGDAWEIYYDPPAGDRPTGAPRWCSPTEPPQPESDRHLGGTTPSLRHCSRSLLATNAPATDDARRSI